MPKLIYCTYLTIYTGNKLPTFYIGSTSVDNINKGYRGSVQSKKYQSIWKQELKAHPDLFKTIILTKHETRQEALDKEIVFHESLSVALNPMYINMAHANGKFLSVGPKSPEHIAKMIGQKRTPETKAKMSGKKRSAETIAKISAGNTGKIISPETRAKMSAAKIGKKRGPFSPEHKANNAAARIGMKQSPETIAKRVAANTGKKRGPYKKK